MAELRKYKIITEKPNQPTVTIDLSPVHEAFCRFLFKTPDKRSEIYAPRTHAIGRAINGYLTKADIKPELPAQKNPVTFIVPETKANWYSLQTKFLYFAVEDNEALADRIETVFGNWCENFFKDGYAMNMDQFMIIECLMDILNIRMNTVNFEAIKKYDYRERKDEVRKRSKSILIARKSGNYKLENFF
jgi:hypothetical protein